MDWFLYDKNLYHERDKVGSRKIFFLYQWGIQSFFWEALVENWGGGGVGYDTHNGSQAKKTLVGALGAKLSEAENLVF